MTLSKPIVNQGLPSTWTDAVTQVLNGFYNSGQGMMSVDYTLTTSEADIGASFTATVAGANAYALVIATCSVNTTVASAGSCAVRLSVGGVVQTNEMEFDTNAVHRMTFSQVWKVSLPVGATILKLRGLKTAAGATSTILSLFSGITVQIFDLP